MTTTTLATATPTENPGDGPAFGATGGPDSDVTAPAPDQQADPAAADPPAGDQPLAQFAPGGLYTAVPAVTVRGSAVVVLTRRDRDVQVYRDGAVLTLPGDAPATPVTDPQRRDGMIRAALVDLAQQRTTTQTALARVTADRAQVLDGIRAYAIEWNRDGILDRDDLNEFLDRFGLDRYAPRVRVSYTITGSYLVEGSDGDAADSDARGYLRPDLDELDNVVDDSENYTVSIDEVSEIDD